ncbi:DUF2806 domain-containing protein [Rhizobium sp. CG4]|uniref:DUF2806 domain-containing protein n=1 Tax=Rhizobium sp. CG4 TaxID=2726075 RepID=UPI002033804A|nr:DUF2806 domain-containing protein [Rhizobium sp. CG4]MCM2453800.1 DUF2806 domain-containing protein [Rhizobium sp. CG4]
MSNDHLDTETSISAELTDSGIKASAKSRTIAAIDRLGGNITDAGNAWIEGFIARKRARNDGERRLIEAAADYGIKQIEMDPEFAERAFGNHFRKVARQQLNKDAVVQEALVDLQENPPSEDVDGPSSLSDGFMDRFEYYAEGATTDDLRQRWGRILAGEIRTPGSFSPKVLRTIDELEASTAILFEKLCVGLIDNAIVLKPLVQVLSFDERMDLSAAGLINDPGIAGHMFSYPDGMLQGREPVWIIGIGDHAVVLRKTLQFSSDTSSPVFLHEEGLATSTYILTDVGRALSKILPDKQLDAFKNFTEILRKTIPRDEVLLFRQKKNGSLISLSKDYV